MAENNPDIVLARSGESYDIKCQPNVNSLLLRGDDYFLNAVPINNRLRAIKRPGRYVNAISLLTP